MPLVWRSGLSAAALFLVATELVLRNRVFGFNFCGVYCGDIFDRNDIYSLSAPGFGYVKFLERIRYADSWLI